MTDYIMFGVIMLTTVFAGILIIKKEATKEFTSRRSVTETLFRIFEYL